VDRTHDAGSHEPDASNDAGPIAPQPAEACSDDLQFVGGTVRVEVGLKRTLDLEGEDLEQRGRYGTYERAFKLPLQAAELSAIGYDIAITAGELDATLYAPADEQGTAVAAGRHPLLVAQPGFGSSYGDYASYFRHFASYGIAVVGLQTRASGTVAEHDKEALETSESITWLLEKSDFREHLDPEKIALSGHSKGGKVSFFAAAIDPRVDIVLGWDPSNAGGPPCGIADEKTCNGLPVAPNCRAEQAQVALPAGVLHFMRAETFVFGVPPDASFNPTPEHNATNFYRGAPSPATLISFAGSHAAWVSDGLAAIVGDANIIRITRTVQTAKLLSLFFEAPEAKEYLPGGDYLEGQGSIVTRVLGK
jgi:hypothetical protein